MRATYRARLKKYDEPLSVIRIIVGELDSNHKENETSFKKISDDKLGYNFPIGVYVFNFDWEKEEINPFVRLLIRERDGNVELELDGKEKRVRIVRRRLTELVKGLSLE